jgi:hypothetical protein
MAEFVREHVAGGLENRARNFTRQRLNNEQMNLAEQLRPPSLNAMATHFVCLLWSEHNRL